MSDKIHIEELRNTAELQLLEAAAASDQHVVTLPTHVARKHGEIIGYASLGAIPLVNCWIHSRKANKFESLRLLRECESAMKGRVICVPCSQESPFLNLLPKLGYMRLGFSSFNLKRC